MEMITYKDDKLRFGKYSTSREEIKDLLLALVAIAIIFFWLFRRRLSFDSVSMGIVIFGIASGFLLHELAHKISAQYYGHISEFRADYTMVFLALVMALLFGFVFFAPGAVMIWGRPSNRQSGIIAAAGPWTNIILGFGFLGLATMSTTYSLAFYFASKINAWLGLFNMIPAFVFDGKKILRWNAFVYAATVFILLLLNFAF